MLTRVFPLKGVAISSKAFLLWSSLLAPLTPLSYFSGLEGAGLQKSSLAGRPGGVYGMLAWQGALGAGLTFSGPVSPLLGGTWSSTAGTARGRARNMDEKHEAAENAAFLPLECNSLRGLDVMHQSCAFWQCLRAN